MTTGPGPFSAGQTSEVTEGSRQRQGSDSCATVLVLDVTDDDGSWSGTLKVKARAFGTGAADGLGDGLLSIGTLAISATAEKFKTTTIATYMIGGASFRKAATDNLTFTAAHVIEATKFGVILIQIDKDGTISTKVPAASQSYASAALALAALPAADSGNVALGHIAIEAGAGDWTANTDDLTNASDLTTASFVDADTLYTGFLSIRNRLSDATIAGGTGITAAGIYEVDIGGLEVFIEHVRTAGRVRVREQIVAKG